MIWLQCFHQEKTGKISGGFVGVALRMRFFMIVAIVVCLGSCETLSEAHQTNRFHGEETVRFSWDWAGKKNVAGSRTILIRVDGADQFDGFISFGTKSEVRKGDSSTTLDQKMTKFFLSDHLLHFSPGRRDDKSPMDIAEIVNGYLPYLVQYFPQSFTIGPTRSEAGKLKVTTTEDGLYKDLKFAQHQLFESMFVGTKVNIPEGTLDRAERIMASDWDDLLVSLNNHTFTFHEGDRSVEWSTNGVDQYLPVVDAFVNVTKRFRLLRTNLEGMYALDVLGEMEHPTQDLGVEIVSKYLLNSRLEYLSNETKYSLSYTGTSGEPVTIKYEVTYYKLVDAKGDGIAHD